MGSTCNGSLLTRTEESDGKQLGGNFIANSRSKQLVGCCDVRHRSIGVGAKMKDSCS